MSDLVATIAQRVARQLRTRDVVNLGIGIPTAVADYLEEGTDIVLQTENGMLGVGPTPAIADVDPNLVNASKHPVSARPGASYFSSSQSFAMIRSGRVDVAVLGALQVDARGRLANWLLPGQPILGVGGAMDLLTGARRVIVATAHCARNGAPKIVQECAFPLSGPRPVDMVVTEHATFTVDEQGLCLTELADGSSLAWVAEHTAAAYRVADGVGGRTREEEMR